MQELLKKLLEEFLIDLKEASLNPSEIISVETFGTIHEGTPVGITERTSAGTPNKHIGVSLNLPGTTEKIPERIQLL